MNSVLAGAGVCIGCISSGRGRTVGEETAASWAAAEQEVAEHEAAEQEEAE